MMSAHDNRVIIKSKHQSVFDVGRIELQISYSTIGDFTN